jgi:hypothetical protein
MYIAHYNETRWIVLSSLFFIIPSIYAFYNKIYFLSLISLLTTIISANYWREATYSWRRDIDIIFAKISFVIYFINGIYYVKLYIRYYPGIILLLYFYYLSNKLFLEKNNNWWKYHMVFHMIVIYQKVLILKSIIENNINKT